jgi:putative FmdB family regulatory protein
VPIYDYKCPDCGFERIDVWAKIEDTRLPCSCDGWLVRQIGATRSNPDWQPYIDENMCKSGEVGGTVVKSRQHRKELMKRYGLVDKWSGC